jgi:glycerophosphoryl diester phosphodiesterase
MNVLAKLVLITGSLTWVATAAGAPCCSTPTAAQKWTVRGNVPLNDFIIQSHRGAGELAPENTIEAFELAWKLGTVPEADIRTTSDGVIVAFHDANFKRVVKNATPDLQTKGVKDITFAELAKLDVGAWKGEEFQGRRVCRMTEVFSVMSAKPERRLYLDIKNVDLPKLAAEVKAAGVGPQVILASTDYQIIRQWKQLVPNGQTLLWMGGTEPQLNARLQDLKRSGFADVTQLQVHVRLNTNSASAEPFTLSRDFLRDVGKELRDHGILYQTLPWNVATPEVYRQLLDLGVASFATDHPEVTLRAVRDYYAQTK